MSHFWITGYERSRTTWLSVLLSRAPAWCYHDLGKRVAPEAMRDAMKAQAPEAAEHIGNADTGLPVFWRRVVAEGEPVLIVERPKQDALEATLRAFGIGADRRPMVAALFDLYEREFAAMRHNANALTVAWDSLDDEGVAEEACEHVLPGVPFDRAWWELLRTKRITERN